MSKFTFEPKYIKQLVNFRPKQTVEAEDWNALWNLIYEQGDYNTESLIEVFRQLEALNNLELIVDAVEIVDDIKDASITIAGEIPELHLTFKLPTTKIRGGDEATITDILSGLDAPEDSTLFMSLNNLEQMVDWLPTEYLRFDELVGVTNGFIRLNVPSANWMQSSQYPGKYEQVITVNCPIDNPLLARASLDSTTLATEAEREAFNLLEDFWAESDHITLYAKALPESDFCVFLQAAPLKLVTSGLDIISGTVNDNGEIVVTMSDGSTRNLGREVDPNILNLTVEDIQDIF